MNIILLKPEQNNKAMIDAFGDAVVNNLHSTTIEKWTSDCVTFTKDEIHNIQLIIDEYQQKIISLKVAKFRLSSMTLELGRMKTAAVDAIRRLMEKLPLVEPLDLMTHETELWSGYADPILDSLLSSPEEKVRFRYLYLFQCIRTNTQDGDDNPERPDSVITIISESRWGRNFGHGEAKVAEPTDNVALLSWDLCRLAFFNKNSINKNETSSSFSFQVKGKDGH
ncbi:hypothetical protein INT45_002196 [Circinella minor]|uniref:Uncharacterized protein n=1 Tax=Circinella minor TaxID=1195481 RepID=A0A8H7RNE6_9FUNG|nr:hypothetical protein INT45_002196 [Circinella minor]